jgi:hypothetical protein
MGSIVPIDLNPQKTKMLPIPNQSEGISCKAIDANNTANIGSSNNLRWQSITSGRLANDFNDFYAQYSPRFEGK